ncbi:LY75, partial [Symbiodinium sp. KB8]
MVGGKEWIGGRRLSAVSNAVTWADGSVLTNPPTSPEWQVWDAVPDHFDPSKLCVRQDGREGWVLESCSVVWHSICEMDTPFPVPEPWEGNFIRLDWLPAPPPSAPEGTCEPPEPPVITTGNCPAGFTEVPEVHMCYKWQSTSETYMIAADTCEASATGARLAIAYSDAELAALANFAGASMAGTARAWVGMGDDVEEGHFVWDDGTPVRSSVEVIHSGNTGSQDCMHMKRTDSSVQFIPTACGEAMRAICQIPVYTHDSSGFFPVNEALDWSAAEAACEDMGAQLWLPGSSAEVATVNATLDVAMPGGDLWLGLNRISNPSNWVTSDGTALGRWDEWTGAGPAASSGGNDCVMLRAAQLKAEMDQCCRTRRFVCKRSLFHYCPNGFTARDDGFCYGVSREAATFEKNVARCFLKGGALAQISTAADKTFAESLLSSKSTFDKAYIGLAIVPGLASTQEMQDDVTKLGSLPSPSASTAVFVASSGTANFQATSTSTRSICQIPARHHWFAGCAHGFVPVFGRCWRHSLWAKPGSAAASLSSATAPVAARLCDALPGGSLVNMHGAGTAAVLEEVAMRGSPHDLWVDAQCASSQAIEGGSSANLCGQPFDNFGAGTCASCTNGDYVQIAGDGTWGFGGGSDKATFICEQAWAELTGSPLDRCPAGWQHYQGQCYKAELNQPTKDLNEWVDHCAGLSPPSSLASWTTLQQQEWWSTELLSGVGYSATGIAHFGGIPYWSGAAGGEPRRIKWAAGHPTGTNRAVRMGGAGIARTHPYADTDDDMVCSHPAWSAEITCPSSGVKFNGMCYKRVDSGGTSARVARRLCQSSYGGDLMSIDTFAKLRLIDQLPNANVAARIGFTKAHVGENTFSAWQWVSGSSSRVAVVWNSGDGDTADDCATVTDASDFAFSDGSCTNTVDFICEYPPTSPCAAGAWFGGMCHDAKPAASRTFAQSQNDCAALGMTPVMLKDRMQHESANSYSENEGFVTATTAFMGGTFDYSANAVTWADGSVVHDASTSYLQWTSSPTTSGCLISEGDEGGELSVAACTSTHALRSNSSSGASRDLYAHRLASVWTWNFRTSFPVPAAFGEPNAVILCDAYLNIHPDSQQFIDSDFIANGNAKHECDGNPHSDSVAHIHWHAQRYSQ